MAKFKKKKSKPVTGKGDSDKNEELKDTVEPKDESQTPPTEKIEEPPKKTVKANDQSLTESDSSEYKKKLDKLFWLRVGLAVIAGSAATFLFDPIGDYEERRWASIGFMIAVFIVSVIIGKAMRIQLPSSDRKKLVTNGLGSYVFIYLFMWIVTYTLVNASQGGGVISPIP